MDKRSEALAELAELDSAELAGMVADYKLGRCLARREALETVRREASILLQQAEGCAANHYGGDHELFGMPGWLADTRAALENAFGILTGDGAEKEAYATDDMKGWVLNTLLLHKVPSPIINDLCAHLVKSFEITVKNTDVAA